MLPPPSSKFPEAELSDDARILGQMCVVIPDESGVPDRLICDQDCRDQQGA